MSEAQEQFGGTPWAVGSMYGIRNFWVTSDHDLTSVTARRPYIYRPGENQASCLLMDDLSQFGPTRSGETLSEVIGHRLSSADCTCGFWAYNDPDRLGTLDGGPITGIIEGYGHVTYGPHGFRASKARIVALVSQQHPGFALRIWKMYLRAVKATFLVAFVSWTIWAVVSQDFDLARIVPHLAIALTVPLVLPLSLLTPNYLIHRQTSFEELSRNYPGVRIFDTVEEAVAAFPLSRPTATG